MGAWIALTLLVIAGLALLLRADAGSIAGFDPSDFAIAVRRRRCSSIFLGSSIAGSYRGRAGHAVRDLLTWALVALLLVAGYSYREEIFSLGHRVVGELLPPGSALRSSEAQVEGERSVRIRRRPDGHFVGQDAGQRRVADHADRYRCIHRGAQAGRCRSDWASTSTTVKYTVPVQTANGTTYAAHVRLRNLAVGPISLSDVEALVAKPGSAQGKPARYEFLKPPALI